MGLSQPLLLKHQINASKLLGAVDLIKKLPVNTQVILSAVKILLEGSNHFSADSEIVLSSSGGDSALLKLELCRLDLLPMLFLQFFSIHSHLEQLIGISEDPLPAVPGAKSPTNLGRT